MQLSNFISISSIFNTFSTLIWLREGEVNLSSIVEFCSPFRIKSVKVATPFTALTSLSPEIPAFVVKEFAATTLSFSVVTTFREYR